MGFLITLFGRREKSSSSVAKDRLLEVLIHDRVKLPPATMEKIREEILAVLSKYIDVDREHMDVSITRADGTAHLTANIPIRRGDTLDLSQPDEPAEETARPAASTTPDSSLSSGATRRPPPPNYAGAQRKRRH